MEWRKEKEVCEKCFLTPYFFFSGSPSLFLLIFICPRIYSFCLLLRPYILFIASKSQFIEFLTNFIPFFSGLKLKINI